MLLQKYKDSLTEVLMPEKKVARKPKATPATTTHQTGHMQPKDADGRQWWFRIIYLERSGSALQKHLFWIDLAIDNVFIRLFVVIDYNADMTQYILAYE